MQNMPKTVMSVVYLAVMALLLDEEDENNKENNSVKRVWVKPILKRRNELGTFHTLFKELLASDSQDLKDFIRLDKSQFNQLVEKLSTRLLKEDTQLRESIKPDEMCCLTLRYLASGETFRSLAFQFRLGRTTVARTINEVTIAIIEELGPAFLRTPKTTGEWLEISRKFEQRWNFPNGLGGVDGKHIVMQQPWKSGSHYRNYKGTDSIILMAMIGPEYEFLFADVGINGRNSDGGIWSKCSLKKALENNALLNIPESTPLPGRILGMPFVCTGDDAFPLTKYMMKPYPNKGLTKEKRVFNYRLSRMRRISENGFGILANRWRVFRRPFALQPEKVKFITLATITLHNWLRSESSAAKVYIPIGLADYEDIETGEIREGSWRQGDHPGTWEPISTTRNNNPSKQAIAIREEFKQYFMNEGSVYWQWKCANIDI